MISLEEAQRLVLTRLPQGKTEDVGFLQASGRILSQDLSATCDIPPFDRSAMDGFALRAVDTANAPIELECVGTVRAGDADAGEIEAGQTKAIMTGAPVPRGADSVQIVEESRRSGDGRRVLIQSRTTKGQHIVPRGAEVACGSIALESGRILGPAEMAVLATFGYRLVSVWRRPRVAIITTGDELVEVNELPRPGQIRNSNAHSISSQLRHFGIQSEYLGIARDDRTELLRHLLSGLECDVVILTGGVSMGEYDFVKEVFVEAGLEIVFSRVAMKPGKPTVFAVKQDKLVFGLPGNPVSTYIAFENIVRPAIGRLCGMKKPELPRVRGILLRELTQSPGRTAFLPARATATEKGWEIDPLKWKGSADIVGFSRADAAVIFPGDRNLLSAGETVEAMLLPDFFARISQG